MTTIPRLLCCATLIACAGVLCAQDETTATAESVAETTATADAATTETAAADGATTAAAARAGEGTALRTAYEYARVPAETIDRLFAIDKEIHESRRRRDRQRLIALMEERRSLLTDEQRTLIRDWMVAQMDSVRGGATTITVEATGAPEAQ